MSTQLMKVENTAFLIEKLASDCSPQQYVRELTKNAIEAIQERQKTECDGELPVGGPDQHERAPAVGKQAGETTLQ